MIRKILIKLKPLRALVILLELLAIGIIVYLVILPFYPVLRYDLTERSPEKSLEAKDLSKVKVKIEEFKSNLPVSDYSVSPNRLIITKIGVNTPIVDSKNSDYGLSKGSWRVPESSTPDKGGNTVLTGHRFKYLPPNNLTFYLFDKLEKNDIVYVIWKDKDYYYRVRETKIVKPEEVSILDQTTKSELTMYTCDPVYSTKNRLVVIADLIN